MSLPVRVVLTGGGTGGHIYPALAVAEALDRSPRGVEAHFVGAAGGMEADLAARAGLQFHGVTARKLRRAASPDTLLVLLALLRGYRQAGAVLDALRPAVVIGTGGYTAAATVIAAARRRIPTLIHEQNAIPGRTNLWLCRWARRICVSFEESIGAFPAGHVALTGVPVRAGIVSPRSQAEARAALGLLPDAFTVLALGGSQGAQRLNEVAPQAAAGMAPGAQVLHHVGARNFDAARACAEPAPGVAWRAAAWLDSQQMPLAYRAADVVFCRCGASTLAEVAANGLPAIMVPYPAAYADHQTANARSVERAGAGILIPQSTLTPQGLCAAIESLRAEPQERARMAAASAAIGRPDAAERVAALALDLAGAE